MITFASIELAERTSVDGVSDANYSSLCHVSNCNKCINSRNIDSMTIEMDDMRYCLFNWLGYLGNCVS